MKVLFVSSGNSGFGIIPFIKSQGESLKNNGIQIEYFTIKGKGAKGYSNNILKLRKYLSNNKFDLIHAHYSLSAYVASIASFGMNIPVITSLMGSDSKVGYAGKLLIKIFNSFFWSGLIVKAQSMKNDLGIKNAIIVPNGVDFGRFKPVDKVVSREIANYDDKMKIISFLADPARYSKNFQLAEKAFSLINDKEVTLKVSYNIPPEKMVYYINASDVILLTSRWEGSPNIVKEALACNVPVVSTGVGDVKELLTGVKGCYIAKSTPDDIAEKLQMALEFNGRTNGRDMISHLEINEIAKRIISIYEQVLNEKKR